MIRAAQADREAADRGNITALRHLTELRKEAGNPAGADQLAGEAADRGHAAALSNLAQPRRRPATQPAREHSGGAACLTMD